MSDHDIKHRSPEMLTFTVCRIRNIRGQRGDIVNAFVKVEYGDKVLGESPRVECTPETPSEINYQSTIKVTFEDPLALDELSHQPVILTLIEVLPKEKKQKEEKTITVGQCTVPLHPLLKGLVEHNATFTINPLVGTSLENNSNEHQKPEVDIQISVSDPLITNIQLTEANLMNITMETLYSPPESWTTSGPQYVYMAATPMPITAERENLIVFAGAQLKTAADKDSISKQKKWTSPGSAQGASIYIPDSFVTNSPIEEEDGEFKSREDRSHRQSSEQDKNRVSWNMERRCYLDPTGTRTFQDKIMKSRYWPVEITRMAVPSGGKTKGKDDDGHLSFHGVAYVNLAPLLYPGVTTIRGAYKVHAYNEHELKEKTIRDHGVAEESIKIAHGILSRSTTSPFPKPTGKKEDKGKDVKKGASNYKVVDGNTEGAESVIVNTEGLQYDEAKSYITLEITLHRPLVTKRQPEELARRVAEYIPPRPLYPKRTNGAQKAVEDFHSQVKNTAKLILEEFRDQFGESLLSGDAAQTTEAMEQRRQKLSYHLNSTGKYFAFKEQLKYSVVKIVREKYLKTTNFTDKDELQAFLSELYVYLVDQMHVALGEVLNVEDQSPIPEPLTDNVQLKHFAREAELNENFDLAAKYYKERIARDKNDADTWTDYGIFCLYINDLSKAEECFKECVSIDERNLNGLLLYGVVSHMQGNQEVAETFFESATSIYPKNILAWTMLGLFYDLNNNEIGAEMAINEANKLNIAQTILTMKPSTEKAETHEKDKSTDIKDSTLDVINENSLNKETLIAPEEKVYRSSPTNMSQTSSDTKVLKNTTRERKMSSAKKPASRPTSTSARTTSAQGHVTADNSKLVVEDTPREPTPIPTSTVFMQSAYFLLDAKAIKFTEQALSHQLVCENGGPSNEYFLAFASLKLQKHELEEAESSLKEALQYNHQNPDAWAMLGHVNYLKGDSEIAKECYERTLAFVIDASEPHSIYLRLASIYLQEQNFEESKLTFLKACRKSASCVSWLGVGIASYRLGEMSESEAALAEANILNNTDPEVWAYLSLVCLKTGRQLEAEQAYKYAIKLKLTDENLLNELHSLQEKVGFGNPQL